MRRPSFGPDDLPSCSWRAYGGGQVGNLGAVLVFSGARLRLPTAELVAAGPEQHTFVAPTDPAELEAAVAALSSIVGQISMAEEEEGGHGAARLQDDLAEQLASVLARRRGLGLSLDYLPVRSELARALGRGKAGLRDTEKQALATALGEARVAAAAGKASHAPPVKNIFEGRVEGFVLKYHDQLAGAFSAVDSGRTGWIAGSQWVGCMAKTLRLELPYARLILLMVTPAHRRPSPADASAHSVTHFSMWCPLSTTALVCQAL